jgi:serine/threonine protein kinase
MEYCDGGDLSKIIQKKKFSEEVLNSYLIQLCKIFQIKNKVQGKYKLLKKR